MRAPAIPEVPRKCRQPARGESARLSGFRCWMSRHGRAHWRAHGRAHVRVHVRAPLQVPVPVPLQVLAPVHVLVPVRVRVPCHCGQTPAPLPGRVLMTPLRRRSVRLPFALASRQHHSKPVQRELALPSTRSVRLPTALAPIRSTYSLRSARRWRSVTTSRWMRGAPSRLLSTAANQRTAVVGARAPPHATSARRSALAGSCLS